MFARGKNEIETLGYDTPMGPSERRQELKAIIEQRCIEFGDFRLSSGAPSNYYYDLKNILLDGSVMSLLGDLLLDEAIKV